MAALWPHFSLFRSFCFIDGNGPECYRISKLLLLLPTLAETEHMKTNFGSLLGVPPVFRAFSFPLPCQQNLIVDGTGADGD